MSLLRVFLPGFPSLTDLGYQFYTQNTPIGSRTETGVTNEGDGYYSVDGVTLQGDHVRWDSTGTAEAKARETLAQRIGVEAIEVDTQDIQSRLPAALVSGKMDSDAVAISGSTAAADAVEANIGNLDDAITDIPGLILDLTDGIETGITPRQAMRAFLARLVGKVVSGGGTSTISFDNPGGTVTRVTFTGADASGNRTSVTLNL